MSNGYLVGCALAIITIIIIMFSLKKRIESKETQVFSFILIANFLEAIITTTVVAVALTINSNPLLILLNKIDVSLIIIYASLLFYYICIILSGDENNSLLKKIVCFDVVSCFIAFFLNVVIINENGILNSSGPLTIYGLVIASLFIVAMIFKILKSKNLSNHKIIPLYFLIFMLIIIVVARSFAPEINLISITFSLVSMVMIFTVENPDYKLIEQINKSRIEAENANKAKSDFLSSMSHEIRTPLNAILGLSESIYDSNNYPLINEDLNDIMNASQTLLEIVGNVLDVNKIESGNFNLTVGEYNTIDLIDSVISVNKIRIGSKDLKLNVSLAPDLPFLLIGDKYHLKMVISNLVSNAIKYTEKGEVNITVKCINDNENCDLIITVQDTGKGIKTENISKLFNKFERLDVEKNSTIEGTGLGLAITKKLVNLMGGTINVQSDYGNGSLFIVKISQKISKMINDNIDCIDLTKNDEVDYSIFKDKKVLVVDDNLINIKVATKHLGDIGCITDKCINGVECITKIKNGEKFDVIIMDIMMPEMGGEEALIELKKISDFNSPVIAVTADATSEANDKYIKQGFNEYLSKPFTKKQLIEKLSNLIKKDN